MTGPGKEKTTGSSSCHSGKSDNTDTHKNMVLRSAWKKEKKRGGSILPTAKKDGPFSEERFLARKT